MVVAGATAVLIAQDLRTGYRSGRATTIVAASLPSLLLEPGRLVCLLGPNGSGKTTLLRTLAGLQPPLQGDISIQGLGRPTPGRLARKISLVLTDRVRGNHLTVNSLVSLGRYPYSGWLGTLRKTDREKVEWAMHVTDIMALRNRMMHTLSDGQHQKVMLARALAQDTPILMLDEPTAHLDLPSRIRLMRLLHRLARDTGKAILLSTHELDLALQIADDLWLLRVGGRLSSGAPEDMVLNGLFASAFAEEDVVFDRDTGVFLLYPAEGNPIRLTGEGPALFWTQRALRRAGFELAPGAPVGVHVISMPEGPAWRLDRDGQILEIDSIQKLLQALA